jgi:hypothetical protein
MTPRRLVLASSVLTTLVVSVGTAHAIPAFARKYHTSCLTCHTVYPKLTPFGEAFRRDGYRYPSTKGSLDSDEIQATTVPMGQDQYKKLFPNSVWPDQIMEGVPLSIGVNGTLAFNIPGSDNQKGAGNTFAWQGVFDEIHLWAAGAFDDKITYFSEITLNDDGLDVEHAYLLFNDLVGPAHAVNFWMGRLMTPSITSWGLHSSYMSDTNLPGTSIAGLYYGGAFAPGTSPHPDGVEVNGVLGHRFDYAVGWLASNTGPFGSTVNSKDVYAHMGYKLGGMTLDGEGDFAAPDPQHPWAETSLTADAFAYHAQSIFDNGTIAGTPVAQNDNINAAGGELRGLAGSFELSAGTIFEKHSQPYVSADGMPPITTSANAVQGFGEASYIVFPWLVPAVRAEYTHLQIISGGNYANLIRVVPGVAVLVRPNVKLVLTGDLEKWSGLPPAGNFTAAGSPVSAPQADHQTQAEAINLTLAWAY